MSDTTHSDRYTGEPPVRPAQLWADDIKFRLMDMYFEAKADAENGIGFYTAILHAKWTQAFLDTEIQNVKKQTIVNQANRLARNATFMESLPSL